MAHSRDGVVRHETSSAGMLKTANPTEIDVKQISIVDKSAYQQLLMVRDQELQTRCGLEALTCLWRGGNNRPFQRKMERRTTFYDLTPWSSLPLSSGASWRQTPQPQSNANEPDPIIRSYQRLVLPDFWPRVPARIQSLPRRWRDGSFDFDRPWRR